MYWMARRSPSTGASPTRSEHELFRIIGYPIEQMIRNDRTTFVKGEIHFRFIGPVAYGDRIVTSINLAEIGEHRLHWNCRAKNAPPGPPSARAARRASTRGSTRTARSRRIRSRRRC
jgi:acyl-CoA thioesterase FadM